jgi:hypothetical protein
MTTVASHRNQIILDWRRLSIGPLRPCVLCGRPALMRNDDHDPCHKVCAEAIAAKQLAVRTTALTAGLTGGPR